MKRDRVVGSCNAPSYFDVTNYASWSQKFEIFLDAHDELATQFLIRDLKTPIKAVKLLQVGIVVVILFMFKIFKITSIP